MNGVITRRTGKVQWSEPWASRETPTLTLTFADGSVWDSDLTYYVALMDDLTTLALSAAMTLSSDELTLTGTINLNTTELVTDRMDSLSADSAVYRVNIVSSDKTDTVAADDVTVLRTEYYYGATNPTNAAAATFSGLSDTPSVIEALKLVRGNAAGTELEYVAVGTTAGTVAAGDDSRLSDARTPTAHLLGSHTTDTLANLNAKVTDATLIDTGDARLSDARTPTAHAASHVTGQADAIQSATNAQDGLMTAAYAGAVETNTGKVTNATHSGDVTGSGELTIANKVTMTATAPVAITNSPTVIAAGAVAISMPAATNAQDGYATSTQIAKLDGIEASADVTDATNVAAAGAVMDADFTAADEIMIGTGAGTHGQVTLAASQMLGRKATGATTNLTATETRAIINVADGADVTPSALTDDSMADTLHRHSELSASDGSPDPALQVDTIGGLDWLSGNVTYVPLAGSIEEYHDAATAGDTLVLADGTYTITDDIDITKAINIVGQGVGQTIVTCATADKNVFDVRTSNVRIANLSISYNATGSLNYGIKCDGTAGTVLSGIVIQTVKITITGAATNFSAIYLLDAGADISDAVITGSGMSYGYGVFVRNQATAEAATTVNIRNADITIAATTSSMGLRAMDDSATQDCIVWMYGCWLRASGGSSANYGAYSVGDDAVLYADKCLFNATGTGSYDVIQATSAVFQVRDCVLANDTIFGTITYAGKVVTDKLYAATNVGIGTTAPDRKLEINVGAATGGIRLSYNDADGSAAVYGDITISSAGVLTLTPVGSTPQIVMGGGVVFPTSDPGIAGVWYDNAGTLTKSAG
jgi:hypothetical protein